MRRRDARQALGNPLPRAHGSARKRYSLAGRSKSCGYAAGLPADAEIRSNARLRCEGFGNTDHIVLLARTFGLCPGSGPSSAASYGTSFGGRRKPKVWGGGGRILLFRSL